MFRTGAGKWAVMSNRIGARKWATGLFRGSRRWALGRAATGGEINRGDEKVRAGTLIPFPRVKYLARIVYQSFDLYTLFNGSDSANRHL